MNKNNEIEVAVFRDGFSRKVLCPYCASIHTHGEGTASRSPHCQYEEHLSNSYTLHPVDFPLPLDALEIDKEARRIYKILSYRSERTRDRRYPKDDAYHAKLEKLKEMARSLNTVYLLKQYFGVRQAW